MKEKFIISLVSQISSYLIYIFAFYLIFYNLAESLIGIWTLLNGVINLGFLFINIGLDSIHYQYSGKKNSEEYFGTYFYIKMFILLVNILITIIIVSFVSNLILWEVEFTFYIVFIWMSKILFNISNIFFINLRTKIKVFKSEIPYFFITIGKSISILILSFNLEFFSDPLLYLSVSNFLFEVIFIVIIIFFSRNEFTINKFNRVKALEYLKDIKPLFIVSITMVIAKNLGDLILDYFFGHEALGHFSLVNNYIIPILMMISGSIIITYLPLFAKYFEKNKISEIKNMTYIIEKYSSIIYLSILLIVLLNGELIITLFLPQYLESIPVLYIMIFVPYLIGITQPYSYQFIAGKKQHVNAYINIFVRSLIILLMIVLIPKNLFFPNFGYGAIGYALAQTLPWILWAILNRYYSSKIFNIKIQKKILLHVPLGFISFFISLCFKDFLIHLSITNNYAILIMSSLFTFLIFLISLCIFREIKKEDVQFFLQLIKFKSYKESLKKEFQNTT